MAKSTSTSVKQRFILLQALEATALQLASIRSILSAHYYVEIENSFYISCNRAFKDELAKILTEENIQFIMVYVNLKTGTDVLVNGINTPDKNQLHAIIL